LSGFGGVLVFARRAIVEKYRWMTADEFNETYALCHFLPGPNIVNLSLCSARAFAALPAGCRPLPAGRPAVVIVDRLARSMRAIGEIDGACAHAGRGSCAAVGLLIAVVLRMMWPLIKRAIAVGCSFWSRFSSRSACCGCRCRRCCWRHPVQHRHHYAMREGAA
jgi:chromate transporter